MESRKTVRRRRLKPWARKALDAIYWGTLAVVGYAFLWLMGALMSV